MLTMRKLSPSTSAKSQRDFSKNSRDVSRLVITDGEISKVELDPHLESADVERSNNYFPPQISKSRFQLFKQKKKQNQMQKANAAKESKDKSADEESKEDE